MHTILSYRGNKPTHKLTGPITVHCTAALLARSVIIIKYAYMYVTMNRCSHLYTNTVYIEYKSVVTHSHSFTHTSAVQPTSVQLPALFQLLPLNIHTVVVIIIAEA